MPHHSLWERCTNRTCHRRVSHGNHYEVLRIIKLFNSLRKVYSCVSNKILVITVNFSCARLFSTSYTMLITEHVFRIDIPEIPRTEARNDILYPDGIPPTNGPPPTNGSPFIKKILETILQYDFSTGFCMIFLRSSIGKFGSSLARPVS